MRICLLSITYPPASTEGIPRQRQVLATELARLGHSVHVVTCDTVASSMLEQGVYVHRIALGGLNGYSQGDTSLDGPLSYGQALYEGMLPLLEQQPFDIVDVPLWSAQGCVVAQRYSAATVIWLTTTSAQLLAINGRQANSEERALLALERVCMQRAGGLLADSRAALDSVINDYQLTPAGPQGVAHLGLPPLAGQLPERGAGKQVEALVVGRLERRKGTPLLFEILPELLERYPQLLVRFVGRDNSASDGWLEQHGSNYPSFFQQHYPQLAERVVFDGYVDEQRLEQCYRQADLLLAPAIYESFGLIYLEAMRAALPVLACAAGGASEIFAGGEQDGALLVPPDDSVQLKAALAKLVEQPELRRLLGQRGVARFQAAFSSEQMALASLTFYQQLIEYNQASRRQASVVYQVMEGLNEGDAVSGIARRNASLLAELGQPATILATPRLTHERLRHEIRSLQDGPIIPSCGLIFHFWGYSRSTWLLEALRGPRAIHYHNITPPHYFSPNSELYHNTARGYEQLRRIACCCELVIGDSRYNLEEFAAYLPQPKPLIPLYPVVDAAEVHNAPWDDLLAAALRRPGWINLLFVGRIARNKRQDQLMQLFDHYYREVSHQAQLWLVGDDRVDPAYRAELEQLRSSLRSGSQIIFTGKVSDPQLNAYYRAADLFVCASEHEGFCMPLAQAMAHDLPVLAYAAAAVPETMGRAGLLIHSWDLPRLVELLVIAIEDQQLRARLIDGQRRNLERFSANEARVQLSRVVGYLMDGTTEPLTTDPAD